VAKIPPDPFSPEFALEEAKRGDPTSLSIRVLEGVELSDGERLFISDLLHAKAGKRYKARRREIEQFRITKEVMALTTEGGQEAAVEQVRRAHNCSRRTIFNALKRFKDLIERAEAARKAIDKQHRH
jgi:hypothetical protein